MKKNVSSDTDDLKMFKTDPVLKNIGRLWDLVLKVIYDKTETDNHAEIFCWMAAEYFAQIKKKNLKVYKAISEQFQKYNGEYIKTLERDEEHLKAQKLKRFMTLLTKKMKW